MPLFDFDTDSIELIATGLALLLTIVALIRGNASGSRGLIIAALVPVIVGAGAMAQEVKSEGEFTLTHRRFVRELPEYEIPTRYGPARRPEFESLFEDTQPIEVVRTKRDFGEFDMGTYFDDDENRVE